MSRSPSQAISLCHWTCQLLLSLSVWFFGNLKEKTLAGVQNGGIREFLEGMWSAQFGFLVVYEYKERKKEQKSRRGSLTTRQSPTWVEAQMHARSALRTPQPYSFLCKIHEGLTESFLQSQQEIISPDRKHLLNCSLHILVLQAVVLNSISLCEIALLACTQTSKHGDCLDSVQQRCWCTPNTPSDHGGCLGNVQQDPGAFPYTAPTTASEPHM